MYETYNKDVHFLMVYIREAHALDSRSPSSFGLVEDPINDKERRTVASRCVVDLGLDMIPAIVDKIDDKVNKAYGAWPDRLYLVARNGKIAFAGGRGPFGFRPDELVAAIKKELGKTDAKKKTASGNDSGNK